jgi:NAD(P)-dependent dehydrogenase (short-subunit alcohol dehydrogenase family)
MKLPDKIGLITGGASGIGRATSLIAAKEGAEVIIADLDDARGAETVGIVKKAGGRASFVHTDVTKENDVRSAISEIISKHGRIDFLHNNAGGWQLDLGDNDKMSLEGWSRWVNLNLTSIFLVTKYVVENMRKRKAGSIVNMSSTNAFFPNEGTLAYSSAKAGVIGFTKEMALQLGRYNIRINAVCPGDTMTPIWQNTFNQLPNPKEAMETLRRSIPLRRFAEPEDIARAVIWLLSEEAAYVTGAVLVVDGGRTVGAPPEQT